MAFFLHAQDCSLESISSAKSTRRFRFCEQTLPQPDKNKNEVRERQEGRCGFIKPREDPSKMSDFTKKAFNKMPFFIQMFIIISGIEPVSFRRNYADTFFGFKGFNKSVAVISLIPLIDPEMPSIKASAWKICERSAFFSRDIGQTISLLVIDYC